MTRTQLLEELKRMLHGPCGVSAQVTEESRLMEDLQLDSVSMLSLAVGLENKYKIRLGEDPDNPPESVGDLLDLLQERVS